MSQPIRAVGYVGIKPVGDLAATAEVLGRALGGLQFVEDNQGRFDEFPAYIAEHKGLQYALLGAPHPQDDLRDDKTDDCQLMVKPISVVSGPKADISGELIERIQNDGRLECWLLD